MSPTPRVKKAYEDAGKACLKARKEMDLLADVAARTGRIVDIELVINANFRAIDSLVVAIKNLGLVLKHTVMEEEEAGEGGQEQS